MRPLNTRERRIQFFRFLALFLLAVLPIVVLVWLHGRVDHVENDFLRKQYSTKLKMQMDEEKFNKVLSAVTQSASDLQTAITSASAGMETMSGKREDGEILNKSRALGKAIDEFQDFAGASTTHGAVSDVAKALKESTELFVGVYKAGHVLVAADKLDLQRFKDDLEKANKDLKTCQDELKYRPAP